MQLSISQARNDKAMQVYQDSLKKNFEQSEVIKDYQSQIVELQNAQRRTFEHQQSSLSNTPTSIQHHEISNGSLYDDFQELINAKDIEILNLNSNLISQSVQIQTLENNLQQATNQLLHKDQEIASYFQPIQEFNSQLYQKDQELAICYQKIQEATSQLYHKDQELTSYSRQIQEATNLLSQKDEQLASYSRQIQDLHRSQNYMIKTQASQLSLSELENLDAKSDQELNEFRLRSSAAFTSSSNFEPHSMKLLDSTDSKVTRPDNMLSVDEVYKLKQELAAFKETSAEYKRLYLEASERLNGLTHPVIKGTVYRNCVVCIEKPKDKIKDCRSQYLCSNCNVFLHKKCSVTYHLSRSLN